MPIVCIGLSHHTAPVEVRERHAFPATRMAEALVALRDYEAVKEAAMLQTCGRLEIYAEIDDYEAGVDAAQVVPLELRASLDRLRHRVVPLHAARASSDRASVPRFDGLGFDADRRSRDPRSSQRGLRASAARAFARQDLAPPLPRSAQRRQDGAFADAHRRRVGIRRNRCGRGRQGEARNAAGKIGRRHRRGQHGPYRRQAFAQRRRGSLDRHQSCDVARARPDRRSRLRRSDRTARGWSRRWRPPISS